MCESALSPARITSEVDDVLLKAIRLFPRNFDEECHTSACSKTQYCMENLTSPFTVSYTINEFNISVIRQWMQQQAAVNSDFASNILFTEVEGFTRDGVLNYRN